MVASLEFPDLSFSEGKSGPALEVSIDFLPSQYEGQWLDVVREFTADWVRRHDFARSGTLWMWGAVSVNLIRSHPADPVPSWSEFIVQFGLPAPFLPELAAHLTHKFERQAGITESLRFEQAAGWEPICHVEGGRAWLPVDAATWEPIVSP